MPFSKFKNSTVRLAAALILLSVASMPQAETFSYEGEVFFCTPTCDSFGALGGATGGSGNNTNSVVVGTIELPDLTPGAFSFTAADDIPFTFTITTNAIPFQDPVIGPIADCPPPNEPGQLCNPNTANPLPLDNSVATVAGSGFVQLDGQLENGELIFVFTVAPFSNNSAVIVFDMAAGSAEGTVFGVVPFTRLIGAFTQGDDADGDGVGDNFDNCTMAPNANQYDANDDGFGNVCDADLNDDCIVNVVDLGILRQQFFSNESTADFNGDGVVNATDLGLMRLAFFAAPGPSGATNDCS